MSLYLLWQLEAIFNDFVVIDVEEVGIDKGLHYTSDNADSVKTILSNVTVDPVRNVERSIESKSENVMNCE